MTWHQELKHVWLVLGLIINFFTPNILTNRQNIKKQASTKSGSNTITPHFTSSLNILRREGGIPGPFGWGVLDCTSILVLEGPLENCFVNFAVWCLHYQFKIYKTIKPYHYLWLPSLILCIPLIVKYVLWFVFDSNQCFSFGKGETLILFINK